MGSVSGMVTEGGAHRSGAAPERRQKGGGHRGGVSTATAAPASRGGR
jgi:hypothetical protein